MDFNFFETLLGGFAILALPFILPFFFFARLPHRFLFYFVSVAICYFCYKISGFAWGFLAFLIGCALASERHEDTQSRLDFTFGLILPGFRSGHPNVLLGLLPVLMLGTLFSVFALRMLKGSLFKLQTPRAL